MNTAQWEISRTIEEWNGVRHCTNIAGPNGSTVTVKDRGANALGWRWLCLTCVTDPNCAHIRFVRERVEGSSAADPKVAA